jgi:NAD(P)-dependent dehydrogenase (short-subunit alcohol dehydrogenase family)
MAAGKQSTRVVEDMAFDFTGKTALVTGAASGIGRAVALQLAAGGANIVASDLSDEGGNRLVEQIVSDGGKAVAAIGDVTDPRQVEAAVALAVSEFGGLQLAFNNAGIGGPQGDVADIDIDGYRKLMAVNLDSVFFGLKFEIPPMLEAGGGAIVNMSSVLGLVGSPMVLPYAAAKHGVTGMTKAAALGYAARGIRINSVHPGYIETPLLQELPAEAYNALAALHPMGRLGTAEEVAEVVTFLLSDTAAFVTGAQYAVDGGYTAQ